ncbi:MAG: FAD:protein FMN transferase, partial [Deltaproteobacteria bacterium]|nr:FAD:protein FMN transferase [Deltaproteobacteria bacterium]
MLSKFLPFRYVLAIAVAVAWLGCHGHPPQDFERERLMMGTIFKVKVHDAVGNLSKKRFYEISEAVFEEIARLEQILSEWLTESPVSAANRQAGLQPLPVPREVVELAKEALKIS